MGVSEFRLPDLGEGLEEAEIVEWHVAPGDRVVADQPLVSVETDKAVVEVPAPFSGTVAALLAEPGDVLAVGAPLVRFGEEARADAGAVVGRLESDGADEEADGEEKPKGTSRAQDRPAERRVRAVPAARKRAGELGVDLAAVEGSGPGGAITRADVERHSGEAGAAAGTAAEPSERFEPLAGARRAMARRMTEAAAVVPATVTDEADVTAWITPEADVLLRLVRACAAAAAASPALNAAFDAERLAVRRHESLRLGIAVDTPEGLYVPVLDLSKDPEPAAVRAELDRLIGLVRDRRLGPADRERPGFTLSNFGPLGGRHAALVIVPPQVGILGAGRAFETVGPGENGPALRTALPLSLTFDHRAVTGGEAARFLAAAVADLERAD